MKQILVSLAILAATATLGSCSFLLGDPYGDYMQRADRWVDLRDEFKTAGLPLNDVPGICAAEATVGLNTYKYLFLQCDFSDNTSRVKALSYTDLGLLSFDSFSGSGIFSVSPDLSGDFRVGGQTFYAGSLSLSHNGVPAGKWLVADTATTTNYLIYTDTADPNNWLHADGYDTAWDPPATNFGLISSGTESWKLARVAVLSDGRVCLLLLLGEGGQGQVLSATFPNFAALMLDLGGGNLLASLDAVTSARINLDSHSGNWDNPSGIDAWITEDGIIAQTSGTNGRIVLSRYPLGPGGEKDSFMPGSGHEYRLYFEASGSYWYLFDRGAGRLVRLRTWWK
jgi:hypothetical protein